MPYLTYEEYNEFGFVGLEQSEFDRLIKKASDVIDGVTRFFYRTNDLESDVQIRKEQFKKAVAAQIEYFHETGSTSSYGINEPETVSIGRTSMSGGGSSNESSNKGILSKDAADYLNSVGLLYRGIGVV